MKIFWHRFWEIYVPTFFYGILGGLMVIVSHPANIRELSAYASLVFVVYSTFYGFSAVDTLKSFSDYRSSDSNLARDMRTHGRVWIIICLGSFSLLCISGIPGPTALTTITAAVLLGWTGKEILHPWCW